MGDAGLAVVGLAVAVGLVGIVVPVLPGTVLIAVAGLVWALVQGGAAWWFIAGTALLLVAGQVAMYLLPGRRMTRAGIRRTSLLLGAVLGVVGFFVVPVLGLPLGFVLGVFLGELAGTARVGDQVGGQVPGRARTAWRSTVVALRNVGLSVAIEGAAGLLATVVLVAGALSLR
ncbi:DUF456 domain-containing protein [Kineococcus rhizosphaerae]|uniref:DUF456 family protein n=1 Tax=Kineococcus rhizosphaerae TaxID=559628 RepID=A0A2T0RB87_9ACTN|nr:DUF456 domain-containing protein [Kineococcus rhizosphaerae]PRY18425.1 hypothetical protein CLV37_101670 [Kineococcus rhizosphaerae]